MDDYEHNPHQRQQKPLPVARKRCRHFPLRRGQDTGLSRHSDNPITHHPRRERPRTQTDDAWLQPLRRRSTGSSDRVSAATVNTHGPPATPLT